MARDGAARVGFTVFEELIVSVLLVLGLAGGPDVVFVGLLLDAVDTGGGGSGGGVPGADLAIHGSVDLVASLGEDGTDVAVGVEGIVPGELFLASDSEGGEGGTNKRFHISFIIIICLRVAILIA